ncbi:hypothetical protein AVEN_76431-1 [Araneus ventricosus]|uniref:Uncharacterized protein n=1 Tax=Araneus ventricosus TaxID=182803 RepID=A0A4Y2WFJ8_ARAVE|nr:hypothetical protein AVEN_76431-1 [Araneus ventricosus]
MCCINIRRDGELVPTTKHFILTFNTPSIAGIYVLDTPCRSVRLHIPNPLRCFKCQHGQFKPTAAGHYLRPLQWLATRALDAPAAENATLSSISTLSRVPALLNGSKRKKLFSLSTKKTFHFPGMTTKLAQAPDGRSYASTVENHPLNTRQPTVLSLQLCSYNVQLPTSSKSLNLLQ